MSIGFEANEEKIGVLLAYISSKISNLNLRKLIKIIFLIDELYIKENGYPLTWLDYFAWKKGPVAPEIYDIKNGTFSKYVKAHKSIKDGKYYVYPVNEFNLDAGLDLFGEYHLEVIDSIINEYGSFTADQLSEITHQSESLWSKTVSEKGLDFKDNGKSTVKLDLISLIKDDEEKYNSYIEALDNIMFTASLNQA
ncbi:Panacea domain-containing protein [Bacteroides sp. 519]|uniref:Panacea domain-containing protein n=1 Tax=Bacteroides sp. 519 TaxID=2302937 RepID=UPI0013D637E9|nr:Panacea domain-containing protein [Bacteroides sp. 519]NDV58277.1 DUF4065 domain-containing protein [Bacteroides sp. 519]